MNLVKTLRADLAGGLLQLRIYDRMSVLTIIPREVGEPVFKREYDYFEADRAERDFGAIRLATGAVTHA